MTWRVTRINSASGMFDGSTAYIKDRRASAHDLIVKANAAWGTSAIPDEVYTIEEVPDTPKRTMRVQANGSVTPV